MTFGDCAWVKPMEHVWKINIRITRQEMIRLRAATARHSPNDQQTASRSFVIPSSFVISISSFSLPSFHSDSVSGIRSSTAFNGYGHDNRPFYGTYQGRATTIDPTQPALAQSAINSDARKQGADVNAQQNQSLAALRIVLRTTTVQPGQMYGGVIEVARPPASSIMSVRVSFAGEGHIFSFRVAR